MRLPLLALLLLVLPGLALGGGWRLRVCTDGVLGAENCCAAPAEASCCAEEDASPSVARQAGHACESCCIDIDTPSGASASTPRPQDEDVKLAHVLDLADDGRPCAPRAPAVRRRAPRSVALAPPGRAKPLPLRI